VSIANIDHLRTSEAFWASIARQLGVSVGTVYQAARSFSKIHAEGPLQVTDSDHPRIAFCRFQKSSVS
jgi:hypothetical protein